MFRRSRWLFVGFSLVLPSVTAPALASSAESIPELIRARAIPVTRLELEAIAMDIPQLVLEEDRDVDGLPDVFE